jgi:hypothetical protein
MLAIALTLMNNDCIQRSDFVVLMSLGRRLSWGEMSKEYAEKIKI